MKSYHALGRTKSAYATAGYGQNPYGNLTPTPSMRSVNWGQAPGLRAQEDPSFMEGIWRNKGAITTSLAAGAAGAKLGALGGAAIGSAAPVAGTAIGGALGGIGGFIGGVGMSLLGDKAGGKLDEHMNAQADKGKLYRPPVTDMSSYAANMLSQGIEENRSKAK